MRCLTVQPGVPNSLQLESFRVPAEEKGSVLIRAVALGICGTDHDILSGKYGTAPSGHKRLIIGHESLGRVESAPADGELKRGDLVMGVVRHPDPVPCENCAIGEWDMCRNDKFTEHGIRSLDGFGSEFYRLDPEFVIKLDPSLGLHGVLVEPTSIATKAWEHIERIGNRALWKPRNVLVTGAGPVGLLASLVSSQRGLDVHVLDRNTDGPKPDLVRDLDATYHHGGLDALETPFDVILECTGASSVIADLVDHLAPNGIACLLGVSNPDNLERVDIGRANRQMVLGNRVVFGSVNANRRHYTAAVDALVKADRAWLDRLITRRIALTDWKSAFEEQANDVKTVILFDAESAAE